ncbi:hypothetical protein Hamer_G026910 [Homarus americanus]|uniref:Uncharacterized protein n=1 Tax=Homarus americanus TaxID=6706 RepID=A0A8J5JTI6_HOMAM|nr:hypothetical protein Hamer_G026910 [Homarus americanus]
MINNSFSWGCNEGLVVGRGEVVTRLVVGRGCNEGLVVGRVVRRGCNEGLVVRVITRVVGRGEVITKGCRKDCCNEGLVVGRGRGRGYNEGLVVGRGKVGGYNEGLVVLEFSGGVGMMVWGIVVWWCGEWSREVLSTGLGVCSEECSEEKYWKYWSGVYWSGVESSGLEWYEGILVRGMRGEVEAWLY